MSALLSFTHIKRLQSLVDHMLVCLFLSKTMSEVFMFFLLLFSQSQYQRLQNVYIQKNPG
jgi:hypothetical protein